MPLVLCHQCWTWVEPKRGRCPQCPATIDLSEPDPSPSELQQILGELLGHLGEMRSGLNRQPICGTVSATTTGLFFLPHTDEPSHVVPEFASPGGSVFGSLGTLLRAPLALLETRSRWAVSEEDFSTHTMPLGLDESHRLPALLMDHPEAFFIARQTIRRIEGRRRLFVVQRQAGLPVRFEMLSLPIEVRENLRELGQFPAWKGVTIRF